MSDLLIMRKRILLGRCPILFDRPFGSRSLQQDWPAVRRFPKRMRQGEDLRLPESPLLLG